MDEDKNVFDTGVYCWKNLVNGKVYVGGAYKAGKGFAGRRREYLRGFARGTCHNIHLLQSVQKYGLDKFEWVVIERCTPDKEFIRIREQFWIDHYHASDRRFGYNICPRAGSPSGVPFTEARRARMSIIMKNSDAAQRQRSLLAKFNRGKPLSAEHKEKISDSQRGVTKRLETRIKMRAAKLGTTQSLAHATKSRAQVKRVASLGGKALTGQIHSKTRKEVQSAAMKGNRNGFLGKGKKKARLSLEEYWAVKRLYTTGRLSQPILSKWFGVNGGTISAIINGKRDHLLR